MLSTTETSNDPISITITTSESVLRSSTSKPLELDTLPHIVQNIGSSINAILLYQQESEKTIKDLVNKNTSLIKTLTNIRSLLEKSLKNHDLVNSAIYESINLCRINLVYLDYGSGKNKIDSPLSDGEKTLPENNGDKNSN